MYYCDTEGDVFQTERGEGRSNFDNNINGDLIFNEWYSMGSGSGGGGRYGGSVCIGRGDGGGSIKGIGLTQLDFNR
jgi:hypothetical protein